MKRISLLILSIFLYCLAKGDIILVPDDYDTIQSAVNAVNDGDTIIVEHGTYNENIVANHSSFTLASRYLLDEDSSHIDSTIIRALDNNDYYSPIRVYLEREDLVHIAGLSITGGRLGHPNHNYHSQSGGGIYIEGGSFYLQNCSIFDNIAWSGGGIHLEETEGIVEYCSIYNNRFKLCGGGICFSLDEHLEDDRTGRVTFENNHIHNNMMVDSTFAGTWGGGIGIACQWSVAGIIHNNIIEGNVVIQDGGGIAIGFSNMVEQNEWLISGNTISNNSASFGGGIQTNGVYRLNFHHNTVEFNSATDGWGDAIDIANEFSPINNIHHNLFRNNHGDLGGSIITKADCNIYNNMFINNYARYMSVIMLWRGHNRGGITAEVEGNIFFNNGFDVNDPDVYVAAVSAYTTDNIINLNHNDFIGNRGYAVGLPEPGVLLPGEINADSNYWGDPSGPYHSEENPNGLGDTVRSNISIEPFSTTPFTA
ncbi:MAG: hypothetical protein P9L92_03215, partial [Candidatus Electryonea clarkiae]|nr:hypothetical protein [Candidatus Electryonea clarkiae]